VIPVWRYDPNVSFYGPGFYGRRTACGHAYTTSIMGVAHRTLPCGTMVRFRNPANGRVVTVPVIDRGPYVAGRQWDLSGAACRALGHCYTGPIYWRFP
jgi:rare lipoprotein A